MQEEQVQYPSSAEIVKYLLYTGVPYGTLAQSLGVNRSTLYRISVGSQIPRPALARGLEAAYDRRKVEFERFREEARQ